MEVIKMPNWGQVLSELENSTSTTAIDDIRRKYLSTMQKYTGRNVIAYYSGFLQRKGKVEIDDNDTNAFMQAINGLDRQKGLDLILHTPGGGIAAAESIVKYLRATFGNNIRAFIPQIDMSAGTMLALSCHEVVMGKQSSLGPIDPQFGGVSCAGVIEEFQQAVDDISKNQASIPVWQAIISKYHPTFLGDCKKALNWSENIVKEWLKTNMLADETDKDAIADRIVSILGSHAQTFSHERHFNINECHDLGIKTVPLESFGEQKIDGCKDLQDCVLTIHHAFMLNFSRSNAVKIVENQNGNAMIISAPRT